MGKSPFAKLMELIGDTQDGRETAVLSSLPPCLNMIVNDVSCDSISVTYDRSRITFVACRGDRFQHHAINLTEIEHIVDASILYKGMVASLREGLTE